MAGIPSPTESRHGAASGVDAIVQWARAEQLEPRAAVAAWARSLARQRNASLSDLGLRLIDNADFAAPDIGGTPSDLGHVYERLLTGETRKRGGVHLTPADVAARLVSLVDASWAGPTARVLDPAVGGGAFLLAAAGRLVEAGVSPAGVPGQLQGVDRDPVAVEIAEAAIALWSIDHDVVPGPVPALVVGDGLLDPLPSSTLVVGNPPFLNQLRTRSANAGARRDALRARWGDLVTAYTDEAWLFLAAAVDALEPGGSAAMVQPVSLLAARHGGAVRARIHELALLEGLWLGDGRVFEASVEVCGPVLRRRDGVARVDAPIRRWHTRSFDELDGVDRSRREEPESWGRLGAGISGVPDVELPGTGPTLGDIAEVTAGFRDQFYGLAPHVAEGTAGPALATVGMLDPFRFRWGSASFRFAGERYKHPALDVDALAQANPELHRWVAARSRPKVLVATQTRVIEAWADVDGRAVPATPTISVEPHDQDGTALWRILAILMTPAVSADLAAACFGTALSIRALKVSASDVAGVPLPSDVELWDVGARLACSIQQERLGGAMPSEAVLTEFADTMHRSLGLGDLGLGDLRSGDGSLVDWWLAAWPQR